MEWPVNTRRKRSARRHWMVAAKVASRQRVGVNTPVKTKTGVVRVITAGGRWNTLLMLLLLVLEAKLLQLLLLVLTLSGSS